jgi:hypothetical protein
MKIAEALALRADIPEAARTIEAEAGQETRAFRNIRA